LWPSGTSRLVPAAATFTFDEITALPPPIAARIGFAKHRMARKPRHVPSRRRHLRSRLWICLPSGTRCPGYRAGCRRCRRQVRGYGIVRRGADGRAASRNSATCIGDRRGRRDAEQQQSGNSEPSFRDHESLPFGPRSVAGAVPLTLRRAAPRGEPCARRVCVWQASENT